MTREEMLAKCSSSRYERIQDEIRKKMETGKNYRFFCLTKFYPDMPITLDDAMIEKLIDDGFIVTSKGCPNDVLQVTW